MSTQVSAEIAALRGGTWFSQIQPVSKVVWPILKLTLYWPRVVQVMARVNIVKKIKVDGVWKLLSLPRNAKGNYDWNALPQGLYLIEWYMGGKRRRESAGVTAAQALEAQRRKKHELERGELGLPGFEQAAKRPKSRRFMLLSRST